MVAVLLLLALASVLLKVAFTPYDCSTFHPEPGLFQAGDIKQKQDLADGLRSCGTITGATEDQVRALLGPPDAQGMPPYQKTVWTYVIEFQGNTSTVKDYLNVSFKNGNAATVAHVIGNSTYVGP